MKRDWELICTLLTNIEEEKKIISINHELTTLELKKEENRMLSHLQFLLEAGFIDGFHIGRNINGHFTYAEINPRLTMAGHDFLDTLRSPKLWNAIKSLAEKTGTQLSIVSITALAKKAIDLIVC